MIPCAHCNFPSEIDQRYCSNCGASFSTTNTKQSTGHTLAFVALLIIAVQLFYWSSLRFYTKFSNDYEIYTTLQAVSNVLSFISLSAPFLIAFSFGKSPFKTYGIILASLLAVLELYWIGESIFHY